MPSHCAGIGPPLFAVWAMSCDQLIGMLTGGIILGFRPGRQDGGHQRSNRRRTLRPRSTRRDIFTHLSDVYSPDVCRDSPSWHLPTRKERTIHATFQERIVQHEEVVVGHSVGSAATRAR